MSKLFLTSTIFPSKPSNFHALKMSSLYTKWNPTTDKAHLTIYKLLFKFRARPSSYATFS